MTIQRMDHVGVVVDDLEAAISCFVELGMELDGGTTAVEGECSVPAFWEAAVHRLASLSSRQPGARRACHHAYCPGVTIWSPRR